MVYMTLFKLLKTAFFYFLNISFLLYYPEFHFRSFNICVGLDSHTQSEFTNLAAFFCTLSIFIHKPWLELPIGFHTLDAYARIGLT